MMKKNLTILIMFIVTGWYLHNYHYEDLMTGLAVVLTILVAIVAIAGCFASWYTFEKLRMVRAGRIELEKQAHVMTLTNHNQTYVRDTNHKATWHNLTLDPRIYSNGHYTEPSETEVNNWQVFIDARRQKIIQQQAQLALPDEAVQRVDLLPALDNAQRCLIVGASNSGKTTLLQHVISRRLNVSKVVVIDPHAYPQKWIGCEVVGIGRNYAAIDDTLQGLVRLMTQRYEEIGRGEVAEESHPKLTIVIDEWRAIVYNLKAASGYIATLLTESRKTAFSVFVGTHSERVKALGIEGEGDLKDGFVIVRLSWLNGERYAIIDIDGKGEQPAILPGAYVGNNAFIEQGDIIELPEAKPDETEQKIIDLHSEGESYSKISQQIYGSKGGKQVSKIKAVLSRFEAV